MKSACRPLLCFYCFFDASDAQLTKSLRVHWVFIGPALMSWLAALIVAAAVVAQSKSG